MHFTLKVCRSVRVRDRLMIHLQPHNSCFHLLQALTTEEKCDWEGFCTVSGGQMQP